MNRFGIRAVSIVETSENSTRTSNKHKGFCDFIRRIDVSTFIHLFICWFVSALVIFVSLFCLSIIENSKSIITPTSQQNITLNSEASHLEKTNKSAEYAEANNITNDKSSKWFFIVLYTFRRLDTLSLMASLILSVALEQMWLNKGIGAKYKIAQYLDLAFAIMGLLFYMAFSAITIFQPKSYLLDERGLVLGWYYSISFILIIGSFILQAAQGKKD